MNTSSILETALAIRPHLSELLDPPTAAQFQQQLDHLLHQFQANEPVEDAIWDLLTDTKATQIWATQFQQNSPEPSGQKVFDPLAGDPSEVSCPTFKCPQCDYRWWRDRVGRPTPFCPTHQIPLERVP